MNSDTNLKKENLGICLLRMLMCFEVILSHFCEGENYPIALAPFGLLREYAVPVFMLMSFYLTKNIFLDGNKKGYKKRFWRLLWPQLVWAFIYWIIYRIIEVILKMNLVGGIQDLIWQIFTGHSPTINPAMWYQTVLILLTFIFAIIFYFLPQKAAIAGIYSLMFFALFLQYTGLNYHLFATLRYELMYPLGRICEMIPYAAIGFLLSYYEILDRLEKYKNIVFFVCCVIGGLVLRFGLPGAKGFGYTGLSPIIIAIILFTIAIYMPLKKLPTKYQKGIVSVSRYTLGIYCMHNLVGRIYSGILGVDKGTFSMCCLLYIMCYTISYIIYKFPLRWCKQLVE